MIIKFVALAAFTAAGVGTVIALNPPEVSPGSAERSKVSVPAAVRTDGLGTTRNPQRENSMHLPRHERGGPRGHDRPRYVPPHVSDPGAPNLTDDGREFEDDWSEHDGWHGEWDDDVRQPQPRESRSSQPADDSEEEDGR